MLRVLGLLALLGALTIGTVSYRERARIARLTTVAAAQRQLAATPLAPAGTAPHAGISARAPIEVRAFPAKLAAELHGEADFHHLVHRCGVCHSMPDPTLHNTAEWEQVLAKMEFNIQAAGLLPLKDDERVAILRVLSRYAKAR